MIDRIALPGQKLRYEFTLGGNEPLNIDELDFVVRKRSDIDDADAEPATAKLFPLRTALSDVHSDIGHIYDLLDIVLEKLDGVGFGYGPTRNHSLDKISSLLWVARDLAEKTRDDIELAEVHAPIGGRPWSVPDLAKDHPLYVFSVDTENA